MSLVVRRATLEDRESAVRIVFDTLRSFGIEPEPETMDADVMRFGSGAEGAYEIVALLDGEICGVSALSSRGGGSRKEGWVSKVFVDAKYRRRGAAKALMADIVGEARTRGYVRLGLQTRTVFKEAIALYEASGWTRGPSPASGPCDRTYWLALG
jgi:GNAT superfamily N-acetyltransferase